MIDDDDLDALGRGGIDRRHRIRAAVDGEDQPGAVACELIEGGGVWPIALGEAIGDVGRCGLSMGAEKAFDQGNGGSTVDVIVAEHRDRLIVADRRDKARRRPFHVPQACRIGQEIAQGRVEILVHTAWIGAARGEHAGEQLRQIVALGDGSRGEALRRFKPLDPAIAPCGTLHTEESGRGAAFGQRVFQSRCRHTKAPIAMRA